MSSSVATTGGGEPRLAGIEWLRFVACLGIVAFHMQVPGSQVALGGLPAFMILTVAFASRSAQSRPWPEYAAARVRTLLFPWIFWSLVLSVVPVANSLRAGRPPFSGFEPWMLLAGPMIHLWYLPFALVVSLGVGALIARRNKTAPPTRSSGAWFIWLLISAGTLVGAQYLFEHPPARAWPEPVAQYISVLACVPIGIGLAAIPAGNRLGWSRLAAVAIVLGGTCAAQILTGHRQTAVPNLVAVVLCPIAWAIPVTASPLTLRISRLSFGIYLLHPPVALVSYKLLAMTISRDGAIDNTDRWMLAAFVASATTVLVWLARKTWLRRVL